MRSKDLRDKADTIKHDAKDAVDEARHRAQAAGERVNRDLRGDDMPLGDRVASHVKEAGHNLKADVDAAKRDVRHAEADKP